MTVTKMSVFDLDRTLVTGNSSFAFCQYLIEQGVLPKRSMLLAALCWMRYTYCGMTLSLLHHTIFHQLLKGQPLRALEAHVAPFVDGYLSRYTNPRALAALRLAQHLGEYTLILSNGPQFLVNAFAQAFKVDACHSTQYAVGQDDRLERIESVLLGEDKARCVHEVMECLNIEKHQVAAYSDSHLDLPLLLAVGNPVVVSPDRKLRKIAIVNTWRQI